jgi:hypothetical protein
MNKCCRHCRHCYCADECDLSGFSCEKNDLLKIIDLDKVHELCKNNYKFSLLNFLLYDK